LQLHKHLCTRFRSSILRILFLSNVALQAAGQQALKGKPPAAAYSAPSFTPLTIGGTHSQLHLCFCTSWSEVSAAGQARVLWIPALDTYLTNAGCSEQQRQVVAKLQESLGGAKLYPPLAWEDLFEHKDRVYSLFGSDYMLPTRWVPLPSLAEVQRAADSMLANLPDGSYMVKGSFSYGALTANRVEVAGGKCDRLLEVLTNLYSLQHQRCVGIQKYLQALSDFELRVFVVPDLKSPGGWRQCVGVATEMTPDGRMKAEQRQPVNGRPLAIARFIDELLTRHSAAFRRALELKMPLLRLDCGYANDKCFLNELCCPGDSTLFSEMHAQDLACVVGKAFAGQMLELLFGFP